MIDDVIQQPLFLSVNGGGLSMTPTDGYDSENLSACEMEPSGKRQAKENMKIGNLTISANSSGTEVKVIIGDIFI